MIRSDLCLKKIFLATGLKIVGMVPGRGRQKRAEQTEELRGNYRESAEIFGGSVVTHIKNSRDFVFFNHYGRALHLHSEV